MLYVVCTKRPGGILEEVLS